ncbi:MAG: hypothetical protein ABEI06_05440 [Halobacteriaceae archaeon]
MSNRDIDTHAIQRTVREYISGINETSLRIWLTILLIEAYILLSYFWLTPADPGREFRYLLYPFVWINIGVWGAIKADPQPGNIRHWLLGTIIGVGYFLLVMYIPGNIGFGAAGITSSLRIEMYAPGWGPLIAYQGPFLRFFLVPFEVIGYVSLSYLVYANVLQFARGIFSGVLGLATCVGCTVPILAPLVGILGGPGAALTTTAYSYSYDIGTLIFVVAILLLYHGQKKPSE